MLTSGAGSTVVIKAVGGYSYLRIGRIGLVPNYLLLLSSGTEQTMYFLFRKSWMGHLEERALVT